TKEWQHNAELRPSYVALRVSAIQRSLDDGIITPDNYGTAISEMIRCLTEGFRLDGYVPDVVHEGFRAFDRMLRMLGRGMLSSAMISECAKFLDDHLPAMCGTSNEYSLADEFVVKLVSNFRETGGEQNPLRSNRWDELIYFGETEDRALANVGYQIA